MARLAQSFPKGSFSRSLLHILSEVEIVFGLWVSLFFLTVTFRGEALGLVWYLQKLSFSEPIFIFVIMLISATRPIMGLAYEIIKITSPLLQRLSMQKGHADLLVILILGPLSGSVITEPAAMTVTAILIFSLLPKPNSYFLHAVLAVMFVNVSVGGALTHFAAPPILMVAKNWGWDSRFVFQHLGWKCILIVIINACLLLFFVKNRKYKVSPLSEDRKKESPPLWVLAGSLLFLLAAILLSHHALGLVAAFILFLGFAHLTRQHQSRLRFRESLLVAFFLLGILLFGGFQKWWLQPLLSGLSDSALYFSSIVLTSFTDNAALTFLGSQVDSLTQISRYSLVAGAIAGGGLTIIANSPNAAGYSILQSHFESGFKPFRLFWMALLPTAVAVILLKIL